MKKDLTSTRSAKLLRELKQQLTIKLLAESLKKDLQRSKKQ